MERDPDMIHVRIDDNIRNHKARGPRPSVVVGGSALGLLAHIRVLRIVLLAPGVCREPDTLADRRLALLVCDRSTRRVANTSSISSSVSPFVSGTAEAPSARDRNRRCGTYEEHDEETTEEREYLWRTVW